MYLEINGWESGIRFSACHFIPQHEKCSRLHGHIYALHARVHGERTEKGMIFDFLELKRALREAAEELDHMVLLPGNSKEVEVSETRDGVSVSFDDKTYLFPSEDCAILDVSICSAEELSTFFLKLLMTKLRFPPNIKTIEVGVDEGKGQGAWSRKDI